MFLFCFGFVFVVCFVFVYFLLFIFCFSLFVFVFVFYWLVTMRDYLIYLVVISRRHCHSLVKPPTPFVTEIWWKNLSGKEATGPCYPCRYDNYRAMWSISNFCLRDMGFITIPLLLYILLTVAPSNNHWEVICIAGAGERPVIAEHAERSPIIIQNGSSIPSSRKNLDLWPYGRPYMVLLLTCVVNCTVGTPTPRLCPVVQ